MATPLEVINPSCNNCVGACCRAGTAIELTEREAYENRHQMTLSRLVEARRRQQQVIIQAEGFDADGRRVAVPTLMRISRDHGLYALTEDCGHLTDDNRCGIYENRPQACRNYEVGSAACLGARQAAGLTESAPPESSAPPTSQG